jgi:hypothetical protein
VRAELDTVQRRRDGIVAQLAALRDLVASFGPEATTQADDEAEPQAAAQTESIQGDAPAPVESQGSTQAEPVAAGDRR